MMTSEVYRLPSADDSYAILFEGQVHLYGHQFSRSIHITKIIKSQEQDVVSLGQIPFTGLYRLFLFQGGIHRTTINATVEYAITHNPNPK